MRALSSVDELVCALLSLEDLGSTDVVPALAHLLQTAESLARSEDRDAELVAAGLVHDLASGLDPGCPDHARRGAELVGPLLGRRVAELVGGHTDAKRYLVTVEPSYAGGLSEESTMTLVGQGGTMTSDEVTSFCRRPEWRSMVALRRADDAAKVPGGPVRRVEAWRELLDAVASAGEGRPRR